MGIISNTFKSITDSYPKNRVVKRYSNSLVSDNEMHEIKYSKSDEHVLDCSLGKIVEYDQFKREIKSLLNKQDINSELKTLEERGFISLELGDYEFYDYEYISFLDKPSYVLYYKTKISNSELKHFF